jgi:hypothetical protein
MVNLESETPYFHWTFDKLEDLNQDQIDYGFEGSVWRCDVIPSYPIGESFWTFDSPEEWGVGEAPVRFHRTPDGRYKRRSQRITYDAVRADTKTHVVLTGRWSVTDFGNGVFVAVFPIKQTEKIFVEDTAKVPIGSYVPAQWHTPKGSSAGAPLSPPAAHVASSSSSSP